MVDAHAIDPPLGIKPKKWTRAQLRSLVIFHTQRGELIDIEKAPPIDFVVRTPPPCKPIMLPFKQLMQLPRGPPRKPGQTLSGDRTRKRLNTQICDGKYLVEIVDEMPMPSSPREDLAHQPPAPRRRVVLVPATKLCRVSQDWPAPSRCRSILRSGCCGHAASTSIHQALPLPTAM